MSTGSTIVEFIAASPTTPATPHQPSTKPSSTIKQRHPTGRRKPLETAVTKPGAIHVLVTEVHKYGWSFEALPGHIAAGGTVEFYIAPGSYAGVETVRLTVRADGQKGSLEATSPVFAEASGRFLWSQMAASMNCSARNAETGVARC